MTGRRTRAGRVATDIGGAPEQPPARNRGKKHEIQHLYRSKPDKYGVTNWTTTKPKIGVDQAARISDTSKFALVVRNERSRDDRRDFTISSITVHNLLLKEILGTILKAYPGIFTNMRPLNFYPPWKPFVHRWDRITQVKEMLTAQADEKTADLDAREKRDVITLFHDLLSEELKDTLGTLADLIKESVMSYGLVWALFEPGCPAISDDRAYKVVSISHDMIGEKVDCKYVDWDGQNFGYVGHSVVISPFDGIRPISELPIYPLRFHENESMVRKKLLTRAAKLQALCGFRYQQYDGIASALRPLGSKVMVSSRVVLDTLSWRQFNPNHDVHVAELNSKPANGVAKRIHPTDGDDTNHLDLYSNPDGSVDLDDDEIHTRDAPGSQPHTYATDDGQKAVTNFTEVQMLITTSTLRGYSCRDKKWMLFNVDNVTDIVWDEKAFDSLVLPESQKELIRAVAESQAQHSKIFDDVITGKGQGMIILLNGPPGVGKTLTAESVAEVMKVPLYYVSSIDLGTTAAGVETELSRIFQMVAKWRAVLLLDEADMFLERRNDHDLERNRLVTVMLRTLEYYEGLLMLTTNRGGAIDDAFQSRIHLRLTYGSLTTESRSVIWKNFLGTAKYGHKISNGDLKDLAAKDLNGRQIKNLLKTAVLLAAKKRETLKKSHIESILSIDPQA